MAERFERRLRPAATPGIGGGMYTRKAYATREAPRRGHVVSDDQPEAREGQAGRPRVAESFAVPRSPVTPAEGRDLSSRQTQYVVKDLRDWETVRAGTETDFVG
jgi:hypothetical protein